MQNAKTLMEERTTVWLNRLDANIIPALQILECNLIASDALKQLKNIKQKIITLEGNYTANIVINEMSMVLVAINQYDTIRFKESYHAVPIVSKTRKALEILEAHLKKEL